MTSTLAPRNLPLLLGAGLASVLFGAIVGTQPVIAVALLGAAAVLAFAFFAPVAHLVVLIALTAVVPFELVNKLTAGGGASPVITDALLGAGLLRALIVIAREPLDARRFGAVCLTAAFLAAAGLQFAHGLTEGNDLSQTGFEFRVLLALGTLIVALPVVADPRNHRRLALGLLGIGLLLGGWGLAQWLFQISYSVAGDSGVREGVHLTTTGRGQIQGGLYLFGVAVILSYAALLMNAARGSALVTGLLALCMLLNGVSLLLTYERTFWITTLLGIGVVSVRAGRAQRLRALIWAPVLVLLIFVPLSFLAPGELTAARERLLSLSQYSSDNSVRYRVAESRHVMDKIREHPFAGSGLADTIHWARPWEEVPPASYHFSHNGYLWMAWKVGIPAALLAVLVLAWAILARGPPAGGPLFAGLRVGAQAALLALLISTATFPAFTVYSATPTMGLLMAIAFTTRRRDAAPAP